jgi:hypothetical protein
LAKSQVKMSNVIVIKPLVVSRLLNNEWFDEKIRLMQRIIAIQVHSRMRKKIITKKPTPREIIGYLMFNSEVPLRL